MFNKRLLTKVYPHTPMKTIDLFYPFLLKAMEEYFINTPNRMKFFLAQIGHESGGLKYMEELASGEAYEGRKDLGNFNPGDGVKYKGRGLIQITGAYNYSVVSSALNHDFLKYPEHLSEPRWAVWSATWYWWYHGLNKVADIGTLKSFKTATKLINGGYNGLKDRLAYLARLA